MKDFENDLERGLKLLKKAYQYTEDEMNGKHEEGDAPDISDEEYDIIFDLIGVAVFGEKVEKTMEDKINEMRHLWEAEEKAQQEAYEETYGKPIKF